MAVAKRTGPDFLFLANNHSRKFEDLSKTKEANVSFHNSSNQDWVSITGEATTTSNDDPRIKEVYSKAAGAWFGDLGDGVHTGGPEDPRMSLIEIKAKCKSPTEWNHIGQGTKTDNCLDISYWKHNTGAIGYAKEVAGAALTGGVANTGLLRELKEGEIQEARSKDSSMSS